MYAVLYVLVHMHPCSVVSTCTHNTHSLHTLTPHANVCQYAHTHTHTHTHTHGIINISHVCMRKTQTTEYLRSVPLGIPHLRGHHGMHFLHVLVIHKTPSCSTCPLLPTKSSLNFTTFSATDFLRAQSKRKSAEKIMSNRAAFSMIQFFFLSMMLCSHFSFRMHASPKAS
jgi:hypothetical protein